MMGAVISTRFVIISVIGVVLLSYGLFFYSKNLADENVNQRLFEEQKQRQIEGTNLLAQHMGSDLRLVADNIAGLANSAYLQSGELSGGRTENLAEEVFLRINGIADRLYIVDSNGIITTQINPSGEQSFVGTNVSSFDFVKQTASSLKLVFSDGFAGLDGQNRVAINYPIINRENAKYVGQVGVVIPTVEFFSGFGNVFDIKSQFLVVFDKTATLLAVGANQSLAGHNFFGEAVQGFINRNPTLNKVTTELLQGASGYAVFDAGRGGRLQTYQPIYVAGNPTYFLQVVTPTATIYSNIEEALAGNRIQEFSLLAGTTAAIAVLIAFLARWNVVLTREVKKRTQTLEEEFNEMKSYLEQVQNELSKHR
jgi:hypothetical protein